MKKLYIILLFFGQFVVAQTANELFQKANEQYKLAKYENAIKTYEQIESLGLISSDLYYNIGNCYYKLNKVAPSIYHYEKALLINPLNTDAENNLIFARRLTIDNIEEIPKSVFQKLDDSFVKKLSYDEWALVSVVFSTLGSILFLLFYFAYSPGKKRLFFVTSIFCFLLLITSEIFTVKEYDFYKNTVEAIIYAAETEVKNSPTENGETVFTLHEGTKVSVLDTVDNWKKIKIADGKIGWMISNELKLLPVF